MNLESFKLALKNPPVTVEIIIGLAIFLIAGLIVGTLLELFLKRFGSRLTSLTKWKFDDFLVRSLKGTLIPLCIVISLYIAENLIPELNNAHKFLNKSCFAAIAFLITLIVARFSSRMIRHLCDSSAAPLPSTFLSSLASVFVYIIGILVTLQTFGISITPILTTLGIGGLAVALALRIRLPIFFQGFTF
jgi:small-conductance mechanosensitive channel